MNYDNLSKEELIAELNRFKEAQTIADNVELLNEKLFGFFEMRSDIIFAFDKEGVIRFLIGPVKNHWGTALPN